MSQEKVNKYKEYKSKRKEILAKEKKRLARNKFLAITVTVLVICGFAGIFGWSLYDSYQKKQALLPTYKSDGYILSDMCNVLETEAETKAVETAE